MALKSDGDIVRGLGYVTLYASYMEEAVEEGRKVLEALDPRAPTSLARRPISAQMGYMQERLTAHEPLPEDLRRYPDLLAHVDGLLEHRNEVIHGRIYAGMQGEQDELRPSRPERSARPITADELYELANQFFEILKPLNHAAKFALGRLKPQ